MIDLAGKRYVVFGVANEKSIAWAITQSLLACKAGVTLSCLQVMHRRVQKLAVEHGIEEPLLCNVGNNAEMDSLFVELAKRGPYDGVVHSIAFSDTNELRGRFIDTSRANFVRTMEISCFSFVDIARRALPLMPDGGSMITLSFDASRGSYPHYNVMGLAKAALEASVNYLATDLGEHRIRVNAFIASPEDTLSARGIGNFRLIGDFAAAMSPFGRRATVEEIAQHAVYLLSPYSSGITGQSQFVDCGSSIPRMPPARNARLMSDAMAKVAEVYDKDKTH